MFNDPNYRYLPLHGADDVLFLTEDEVRRLTEWTEDEIHDQIRNGVDCVECHACGQRYFRADACAAAMGEQQQHGTPVCSPSSNEPAQLGGSPS